MTASLFIAQLLNGLQYGIMLFLLAAGLTLVFGIMSFVNLAHVSHFVHGKEDSGELHLRGRAERLPVSRSYVHLFQRM